MAEGSFLGRKFGIDYIRITLEVSPPGDEVSAIAEVHRSLSADRWYNGRNEPFYGSKQFGQKARLCHPRYVPASAINPFFADQLDQICDFAATIARCYYTTLGLSTMHKAKLSIGSIGKSCARSFILSTPIGIRKCSPNSLYPCTCLSFLMNVAALLTYCAISSLKSSELHPALFSTLLKYLHSRKRVIPADIRAIGHTRNRTRDLATELASCSRKGGSKLAVALSYSRWRCWRAPSQTRHALSGMTTLSFFSITDWVCCRKHIATAMSV